MPIFFVILHFVPRRKGTKCACATPIARLEREEVFNMYAIIATGGKQFKVEKDQIIKVEKLDANKGDKVTLDVVMLADDGKVLVGDDLKKAKVEAEVLYSDKSDKVIVYKYKAKKNERKRQGHRQPYTALKILSIKK